ncbi:AAA family ATPase [Streptomyces sp. NPDC006487]|uniref:AAA family ATPase n=1 Tax=Streptomyces sp. NPDC006487 TaxID=3364748 RepID=UPI00368B6B66
MRIGVSGTHGTGKTTLVEELCVRLPGHEPVDEPYLLLMEDDYLFGDPPTLDDYRMQLRTSLALLRTPGADVVFDRTPVDLLAYLAAYGREVEQEVARDVLEAAMSSLDLLVLLRVTTETERLLPEPDLPDLREAVDGALAEIVHTDPLDAWPGLPVLEPTGPLDRRTEAVLGALAGLE